MPIGNNRVEVLASLPAARSGVEFCEAYRQRGFRCHVPGSPKIELDERIGRKLRRFMGDGAADNCVAMEPAIADPGPAPAGISNQRTGLVVT